MTAPSGHVVLITGTSSGIGLASAIAAAQAGFTTVATVRDPQRATALREAAGAAGVDLDIRRLDITDGASIAACVRGVTAAHGRLDALVNNAGILRDRMLVNMTPEEWDAVIRVHLRGTYAPSHWAARHWRERSKAGEDVDGRLINTSSSSGIYGNPGQSNYGAAKAGIAAFTVITAKELARYGITVNAIAP
ncbi:MAG: short-chain dehydrogenase, partial [Pseudonocardiales bacterium]